LQILLVRESQILYLSESLNLKLPVENFAILCIYLRE
jgi:hypothetical protein